MCSDMNQPMTRRSAHDVGDAWTTVDATEMYEIARWGQGYFSIGENGHVRIHPTKETDRSIDLKMLVDHLQLRGISLPTLVRFRDILRHRLQDIFTVADRIMVLRTGQSVADRKIADFSMDEVVKYIVGAEAGELSGIASGR